MNWTYKQTTAVTFGMGARKALPEVVAGLGARPILVTDAFLRKMEMTREVLGLIGAGTQLFAEVEPNPTVSSVDALADMIRSKGCDVVVALGGGSSLDCAKAACSVAAQGGSARDYHSGGKTLDARHLPLVAVPTTAGTGSEVTPFSVLDDPEKGIKAPLAHDNFFPKAAVVDPELTVTMPRSVTAATGLDALAHAVEGYWSKNHQPICDLLSFEAVGLVFTHLQAALDDGSDIKAREGMMLASLLAGMAFQLPKNAASHACSFPLSSKYHLPHGTACAMTLDHFTRFNAEAMGERGVALANAVGFADMEALADAISEMKAYAGLPTTLSEVGVRAEDIDELVYGSFHPLIKNNPREVTAEELRALYLGML
ncbi:MAG: iron-containing alcohol dehydrogenase family protein [Armatimonadota bacterium]